MEGICGELEASCICIEDPGHESSHHCWCGGAWHWEDGIFHMDEFPGRKVMSLSQLVDILVEKEKKVVH